MPKNKKTGKRRRKAALGWIMLGLGVFLGLSWFGLGTGLLGQWLQGLARVAAGDGGLFLAAALALGGVRLIIDASVSSRRKRKDRRPWAWLLLFFCLLTGLHLPFPPPGSLGAGWAGQGGGVIGAGIWWATHQAFGPIGGRLALAAVTLVALNLASDGALGRWARQGWRYLGELPRPNLKSFSPSQPPSGEKDGLENQSGDSPASRSNAPEAPGDQALTWSQGLAQEKSKITGAEEPEHGDAEPHSLSLDGNGSDSASGSPGQVAYQLPPLSLLSRQPDRVGSPTTQDWEKQKEFLENILREFGVEARVMDISAGPAVTRYELSLAPGTKVNRIVNLADDLGLHLAGTQVRIEAPIPGKAAVGIEVPRSQVEPVYFREVAESVAFRQHSSPLALGLGVDIAGEPVVPDLHQLHHLLVAGATGSGKSVCLNAILASFLLRTSPDDAKLILIDPKRVEFTSFHGLPHLLTPVVVEPEQASSALAWALRQMEERYRLFAESGVRDLARYNDSRKIDEERLPRLVVVIDELADLMLATPHEVEDAICRVAQMGRAAGIHLIVATQRPSVDVITGLIKANIPSRISFAVSSQADSRTILDGGGAERLQGQGDLLYLPVGASKARRVQGAFIPDEDIEALAGYWREQKAPEYLEEVLQEEPHRGRQGQQNQADEDELLSDALQLVAKHQQASASLLQRRFRIGYTRAARLLDLMEERGWVGPPEGSKARTVLMGPEMAARYLETTPGTAEPDHEPRDSERNPDQ